MINLVEDIRSISYVKSHTAEVINLAKILSIGENDLKNGRIYSHEELQRKIKSILD